jgi:hypothetical protein
MDRKRKFEEELLVVTAIMLATLTAEERADPIPKHTSILTGNLYFEELLQSENEKTFHESARMDKHTFNGLLNLLKTVGALKNGRKICAGEKLMMFIQVLKGLTIREIGNRFQHSESTISEVISEVINSMLLLSELMLIQPTANQPDSAKIINDPKFYQQQ